MAADPDTPGGTRWAWLLAGAALAMLACAAAALLVVETGAFDARASTQHDPVTAWATHATMVHSMRRGAGGVRPPPAFTAAETVAGLRAYEGECLDCHGGPGVARAAWVRGMNPTPPFLLDASRRWSRAQLFWIVKNGVKMTGMPAWGDTEDDGRIWDVVAFLEAMPDMDPAAFQRLRTQARAAEASQPAAGSG